MLYQKPSVGMWFDESWWTLAQDPSMTPVTLWSTVKFSKSVLKTKHLNLFVIFKGLQCTEMHFKVRKNLWFRKWIDPIVKVVQYSRMKAIPFLPSALNIVSIMCIIYTLKCSFARKIFKKGLGWLMHCNISVTSPWGRYIYWFRQLRKYDKERQWTSI